MSPEDIKEINDKCPSDQGIFIQPSMIPITIKGPVIYSRYSTGGMSGGNCWGDEPYYQSEEIPEDHFKVLDLVLEKLMPNITYLQYKKLTKLIHNNSESRDEYYGNSTDWAVEYIILSELELFLEEL